jgi:hypothetical protein
MHTNFAEIPDTKAKDNTVSTNWRAIRVLSGELADTNLCDGLSCHPWPAALLLQSQLALNAALGTLFALDCGQHDALQTVIRA